MKYRIRIENYNSGKQKFYPQVQFWWLFWGNINYFYDDYWMNNSTISPRDSREEALQAIDVYHSELHIVKSIEFEYINKD